MVQRRCRKFLREVLKLLEKKGELEFFTSAENKLKNAESNADFI